MRELCCLEYSSFDPDFFQITLVLVFFVFFLVDIWSLKVLSLKK